MPKIALITTGGTIASSEQSSGDVTVSQSGQDLLRRIEAHVSGIEVELDDYIRVGSFALGLQDSYALARHAEAILARPDIDGAVITHGTDTLEESAFLADIIVETKKPLVLTGAQRPFDEPESDGPRNLADAIMVAASSKARGRGVLVVFNQEIHAARHVTKSHTSRLDTFTSGEHGRLGEIDQNEIYMRGKASLRTVIRTTGVDTTVALIKLSMGCDGRMMGWALDNGAAGIVLEAFGRGNVTPGVYDEVVRADRADVPVIVTSRCPRGRVAPIYGNSGGAGLKKANAIFAHDLGSVKARILLSLLLADGESRGNIASVFETIGAGVV